jgi:hypothetical protein
MIGKIVNGFGRYGAKRGDFVGGKIITREGFIWIREEKITEIIFPDCSTDNFACICCAHDFLLLA